MKCLKIIPRVSNSACRSVVRGPGGEGWNRSAREKDATMYITDRPHQGQAWPLINEREKPNIAQIEFRLKRRLHLTNRSMKERSAPVRASASSRVTSFQKK